MADSKYSCGPEAHIIYRKEKSNDGFDFIASGEGAIDCSEYFTANGWKGYAVNLKSPKRYSLKIGNGITQISDDCFPFNHFEIVKLPESLIKIGSNCFKGVSNIVLPQSLQAIGNSNFGRSLKSITLPANSLEIPMDNFEDCDQLEHIIVPEGNTRYVVEDDILYTKDYSTVLFCPRNRTKSVVIHSGTNKIGDSCFANCRKLSHISIPSSVKEIGREAFYNVNMNRLILPMGVERLGVACFFGSKIKELRGYNNVDNIPDRCFAHSKIDNLRIPKGVKYIGDNAFDSTAIPTELHLESCTHIGKEAFRALDDRECYIYLTDSIHYIGDEAFKLNETVEVYMLSVVPPTMNDLQFNLSAKDELKLYVPHGTRFIYEIAPFWTCFADIDEWDFDDNYDKLQQQMFYMMSSITNVDRAQLKDIFYNTYSEFELINDDDSFDKAIKLIGYNRKFTPVIMPELEYMLFDRCTVSYRIKMMQEVFTTMNSPLQLVATCTPNSIASNIEINPPLLPIEIFKPMSASDTEAYFDDILDKILSELSLAENSIKVAVSWLTNYTLFSVLLEKAKAGLEVVVVTNNDLINNGGYCLKLDELIEASGHIHLVEYPKMLHHKFCIIDDVVVITGSYNWTRFSANNHENVVFIRQDSVVKQFVEEFEWLCSEYEQIISMPDTVEERPQYDRSSFKQYVTEELDAQARESSDHRERITALKSASKLNSDYLSTIHEGYESEIKHFQVYEEAISSREEKITELEKETSKLEKLLEKASSSSKKLTEAERKNTVKQIKKNHTVIKNVSNEVATIKKAASVETVGNQGKIRINLKWFTLDDLDLHVNVPNGEEIYYSNKRVVYEGCTGELDFDANASESTKEPQENIYWDKELPLGDYTVSVEFYAKKDNEKNIPYIVSIETENGQPKILNGVMKVEKQKDIVAVIESTADGIKFKKK